MRTEAPDKIGKGINAWQTKLKGSPRKMSLGCHHKSVDWDCKRLQGVVADVGLGGS